jgi:hypothetical protein
MNASEMLKVMNRTLFEPFEIHLADGVSVRVEFPWQVATSPHSPVCAVFDEEHGMRIIAFRNVTEIVTPMPV